MNGTGQGKHDQHCFIAALPLCLCSTPDLRTHVRAIQDVQPLVMLCLFLASGLNLGLLVASSCSFTGIPPGDTCRVELPCHGGM